MIIKPAIVLVVLSVAAGAAGRIKVSCIGNSITEGNMGGKYPVHLQALLGSEYQVENDGVSGTTMLKKGDKPYWTKGKFNQVFAFKPDIVTIKLGTNDTKSQNWDPHGGDFKKDCLAMIDTLDLLSTKPDIFVVLPVPVFKTTYGIRDSILKKIIVIIKEIAIERTLPVIDANTPLLGFSRYFSDGVHPNEAGADTIAHVIYRALMARTKIASEYSPTSLPSLQSKPYRTVSFIPFSRRRLTSGTMFDLAGRAAPAGGIDDRFKLHSARLYLLESVAGPAGEGD
ncbi:MAG: hypothetical protein JW913_05060 [Chitinispirillaceae bacterium]|nr:hypothetical protein [Chitinispirillaceae bacterium]